jgi:biopolymer transport protein ExbD
MRSRGFRRIVLDLTPMVDVIMILLFGVMINSVARTEVGVSAARAQAEAAAEKSEADRDALVQVGRKADRLREVNDQLRERLAEAEKNVDLSQAEREKLADALQREKFNLAAVVAKQLQLTDAELERLRQQLEAVSGAGARRLAQIADEMRQQQDPVKVYRAVKRIEEMQKVFTFVDLHVDATDFLTVVSDAQRLGRFPVRSRTPDEIENEIRHALEAVNFNQMVLILYSYEGEARDLSVERTESAINSLLSHYRGGAGGQGRYFRYGRVGLIDLPPVTIEEK